ncbi:DUF4249 domain-containing protein [Robiginitalea sp. IMCC43444]|uniref:DUF4249 domain-containing protein n=1 Tax=Robiginitalea sp. IMCC43444 TaxID=3459121 RepID=UPI004042298F
MKKIILAISIWVVLLQACIDPFPIEQNGFEDILVVEATLTDEQKVQQIRLSRTYPFDSLAPVAESGATVSIQASGGQEFTFQETEPGLYSSSQAFGILPETEYRLEINSRSGTTYLSDPESLPGTASIDRLYAVRESNENGTEGVFVYLDGSANSGNADYFRYEYEETYKIIAPEWSPEEFLLTNYDPCALPEITYNLEIVPRSEEQQVCYNTVASNSVILNDGNSLSGDAFEGLAVRFLGATDFMIRHRYSILVKQYVQQPEAFSYYQALSDFSSSENIFNSTQPGFLNGNIRVAGDPDAKVIGYFELATVSEERLFFNFEDIFPDLPIPPYIQNCIVSSAPDDHISYCAPGPTGPNPCPRSVVESVDQGLISYVGPNSENLGTCPGTYAYVPRPCGDCRELGSNIIPEFWTE